MEINVIDWGLIPYAQAYERQKTHFDEAIQRKMSRQTVENRFILCEHPHVITLGKNALQANLLFPEKILKEKQVELYQTDRGGDITYHGPGQMVGYPILDLETFNIGIKEYIYRLEEVIIQTISNYGIAGERLDGATGVWIDTNIPRKARKIAAIGVRSSRYVTMHGFALNVNTDLSYFQLINPCGFRDKGVTSIQKETGLLIDIPEVKTALIRQFQLLFTPL
ncbi:MAG: lipoyl(octanoyl) transferase LipB [Dysgonamonadaceae bacterium]|jgi:lipoyl(octanoyl) transferase|nr:lipoyl(octanoyl) transferase LipB [Dysgonamonadaceae bacterium]